MIKNKYLLFLSKIYGKNKIIQPEEAMRTLSEEFTNLIENR